MSPASILIVEDEAVVALDLRMLLTDLGYEVVGVADTAARAIELAARHQPALTLMDVMLKGEGSGIDAAATLQRELQLPVLFLTSYSDTGTVARAAETAPYGYLTKPFQIRELQAGIEVALSKSRLERQLRDSERWFAATLRCVQDGVLVVDAAACVRFLNPAAEQLTGWSLDEALGRPVREIAVFGDADAAPCSALLALDEARVIGVRHGRRLLPRDGAERRVDESAGPVRDSAGLLLGAVLVLRDAAARLRQERRLRESEQRFRAAFDTAPLGMALVALDGRFLQVNDALCRLLRCDAAWLLQQTQADISEHASEPQEAERLHALDGSARADDAPPPVVQFEKRYRRSPATTPAGPAEPGAAPTDDAWVSVLVSVSLLQSGGDGGPMAPTCYLYQVHDLTAQHAAAARLAALAEERIQRESTDRASRTQSAFLSRVSHEMRTPLNAVLGLSQLLRLEAADHPARSHGAVYAEHIETAGRQLLGLVDDLLDLRRSGDSAMPLPLQPVLLADTVSEVLALLRPLAVTAGVTLVAEVPGDLAVLAHPSRLRQMLLNLCNNAVQYNRRGGHVRIGAAAHTPDWVRLTIEDDGLGLSAEQQARLFQPFDRLGRHASAVPGVGLGLVIARKLVEAMGGTLAFASPGVDAGAVATLELVRSV